MPDTEVDGYASSKPCAASEIEQLSRRLTTAHYRIYGLMLLYALVFGIWLIVLTELRFRTDWQLLKDWGWAVSAILIIVGAILLWRSPISRCGRDQTLALQKLSKIAAEDASRLQAAVPQLKRLANPWTPTFGQNDTIARSVLGRIEETKAPQLGLPIPHVPSAEAVDNLPRAV